MARSFAFAFNNSHFSDRLLLFEVSTSPLIRPHCKESIPMENEEDGERYHAVKVNVEDTERLHVMLNEEDRESLHEEMHDECSARRFRVEVDEEDKDSAVHVEMDEGCGGRLPAEMMKEENGQDERLQLHVNSVILASHSEYFMSLFCNGMSESSSEEVVVQVTEEERIGLISLIEYMYTGQLREPSSTEAALMLLRLADRFAIHSCMERLAGALGSHDPRALHDCLLVLGLPEALKSSKTLRPIVAGCCEHLRQRFRDVSSPRRRPELLALSIDGFKAVLGSELLDVQYEEEVFDCLCDWIGANYGGGGGGGGGGRAAAEELAEMVRFPWVTGDFLEDVVSGSPVMRGAACQALVAEALRFRSYTRDRQHRLMLEASSHGRFRPRNSLILDNFWGPCKTHVLRRPEPGCRAHFEFPLERVVCMGETFTSRSLTLGPDSYHTLSLCAAPRTIKTPYSARVTCCLDLVRAPTNPAWITAPRQEAYPHSRLEYTISMRRQFSQECDSTHSGHCDLDDPASSEGTCARFDDLFPGWYVERGFSYPRWNLSIDGPVFVTLDLRLCSEQPNFVVDYDD